MTRRRISFFVRTLSSPILLCLLFGTSVFAQARPQPVTIGDITVSGSVRTRVEAWDWFEGNANGDYAYPGSLVRVAFGQSKKPFEWQIELAVPFILGLPDDAVAPGAQGQLGLGASYFAANNSSRNAAMLFVKQGFIRFRDLGGVSGQSLKVGRSEFIDGTEVSPGNPTLAALKRDRVAHRLLGNFVFSHVGRSFDGVQYAVDKGALNFTALAGRPTRGVFQVDGWGELNVNVLYGALTGQIPSATDAGDWRLFGLGYSDARDTVVKTDNRPPAARRADTRHITIAMVGGHYLEAVTTPAGVVDVLTWAAGQAGSWGALSHRAVAFAAEAGWQPSRLTTLRPWIRGGYNYGSGDHDPSDATHGTFFQALPTPRVYARFPFYNMMNTGDAFAELLLRPSSRFTVRTDVHALRLSDPQDLWYQGGGAFQPGTFGYVGRPSTGQTSLATLYDISADYTLSPHVFLGGYYGHAAGGRVTQALYPQGNGASLGYVEMTLRF